MQFLYDDLVQNNCALKITTSVCNRKLPEKKLSQKKFHYMSDSKSETAAPESVYKKYTYTYESNVVQKAHI